MTGPSATGSAPDGPDVPATLAARSRDARRGLPIPPVGGPPPGDEAVYMVAGGDMVAVFDNPEAAGIMAVTMTGANLEPEIMRLTPAQWAQALAVLRKHFPYYTITDAQSGRPNGAP